MRRAVRTHAPESDQEKSTVKRKPTDQPEVAAAPVVTGGPMTPAQALQMQRTAGNRAVQRALAQTQPVSPGTVQRQSSITGGGITGKDELPGADVIEVPQVALPTPQPFPNTPLPSAGQDLGGTNKVTTKGKTLGGESSKTESPWGASPGTESGDNTMIGVMSGPAGAFTGQNKIALPTQPLNELPPAAGKQPGEKMATGTELENLEGGPENQTGEGTQKSSFEEMMEQALLSSRS